MNINLTTRWARRRALLSLAACVTIGLPAASFAASPTPAWQTVGGSQPLSAAVRSLGQLADGETMHIVLSLKPQHMDALKSLVDEQKHAGSPAYRQYLSAEAFNNVYAPSQAQADAVADYLRSHGFVNVEIAPNRMLVSADGAAGIVQSAFDTTLDALSIDGRRAFANASPIRLPAALAADVTAVLGLQTVTQFHTLAVRAAQVHAAPLAASGQHGYDPTDFPAAYGVGNTPDARNTTVGVVTAGDLSQTLDDLAQFQSSHGLPSVPVDVVQVGRAGSDTSGTGEWDLDTQDIQSMAGGRVGQMLLFDTTSLSNADITAAYNAALNDGRAKLVNVSLGECEQSAVSDGTIDSDDNIFMSANAQGMMFSVSSGDSGSHECSVRTATRSNSAQSYPASSPYVIAVGGTTLTTNGDGSYAGESAWIDGGGGASTEEYRPAYQDGIVSSQGRGVPDIALDADPNTGAIIIVNGRQAQYGGTSLASPLFVGLYARIESATGNSHGFPVPSFYQYFPSNTSLVHDVTTGNNGGRTPYTASAGWDYTTGFGSPVISRLYSFVSSHSDF